MAPTYEELVDLINKFILSGGRRTAALNLRIVLDAISLAATDGSSIPPDLTAYFKKDGSVAMTGNLNLGSHSLVNGFVDWSLLANITVATALLNGIISHTDWNTFNNKQNALGFTPENVANKGIGNGYASLDSGAKVPASQLPSYVDDVLEYATFASFPVTGETGKIYIDISTTNQYRWSGSVYVQLTNSSAVWGNISGLLSNQTDLLTALNLKLAKASNLSDLANTLTALQNLGAAYSQDVAKSANFTILSTDRGKVFEVTTSTSAITATLDSSTLVNGFMCLIRKADAGVGTIVTSPATQKLGKSGHTILIWSDGTSYFTRAFYGAFDSSGNLTISSIGDINLNPVGNVNINGVPISSIGGGGMSFFGSFSN